MTRILAYRFSAFGDVAMTVPVFREFLEQNPGVEIIMVSRKNFEALFEGVPNLIFKGIDVDNYKGIFGLRRLSNELIKEFNPDFIANLHDVIRTKIIDKFYRRKGLNVFKINKGKEEKDHLTDVWNLNKVPLKRTVERYADVFREMGFKVELSHQLRPVSENKSGIGFAPFAQHKGKMLPLEKSFELARILAKKHTVYFFGGGKKETETLEEWENKIPNTKSLSGKLKLTEELIKISELEVMISMDSANMHLASLVGTRCVSVWAATHPYAGFLGFGQSEQDVVQVKDLTCRPCSVFGDKECYRGDWACLEEFNIQKIIEKI
ncbi:glycosyltransferase family 9 protein [Chryseobacterium indologenes]|nr:glycosyltransferase family 9 protein [Chryseobacterium indologenes]MEB4760539.1 glycosyltransferase family 9 protein [Chryseobacterium indologenes]UDQ54671.1 glycosyltransferase family 9 protein [Chryseobacterium indologenes]SFJ67123.1 ADP-heptose:LPS heptosyltransferase [Chryseobacterium indologenes]SUX52011.1 lipopolysaccharide heptosyltransferase II [Chryseobacterium indologenes]GAE63491.1 putative glycosyltransferase [Chryseobacterium indologenes NBRC 14944]